MIKQTHWLWMGVWLAATMVGCNELQKPTIEVVNIELGEQTDEGAVVNFTLRMQNPNEVALPVRKASYRVAVEGVEQDFKLMAVPPVTLPIAEEQFYTFPAAFATHGVDLAGRAVKVSGEVFYQPPGEIRKVLIDMNVPLPSVSFEADATLK